MAADRLALALGVGRQRGDVESPLPLGLSPISRSFSTMTTLRKPAQS
jgi:hypothetical protein